MFPFPGAERLSEEQRDTLEMMVDPADGVSAYCVLRKKQYTSQEYPCLGH